MTGPMMDEFQRNSMTWLTNVLSGQDPACRKPDFMTAALRPGGVLHGHEADIASSVYDGRPVTVNRYGSPDMVADFGAYQLGRLYVLERVERAVEIMQMTPYSTKLYSDGYIRNVAAAYCETAVPRWDWNHNGGWMQDDARTMLMDDPDRFLGLVREAKSGLERAIVSEIMGQAQYDITGYNGKPVAELRSEAGAAAFLADCMRNGAGASNEPFQCPNARQLGVSAMQAMNLEVEISGVQSHDGPYYDLYRALCAESGSPDKPVPPQKWTQMLGERSPVAMRDAQPNEPLGEFVRHVAATKKDANLSDIYGNVSGQPAPDRLGCVLEGGPSGPNTYGVSGFQAMMDSRINVLGGAGQALRDMSVFVRHYKGSAKEQRPSVRAMEDAGLIEPGRSMFFTDAKGGLTVEDMRQGVKDMSKSLAQHVNYGLYGTDEMLTEDALKEVELRLGVKVREMSRNDVSRDMSSGHVERPWSRVRATRDRLDKMCGAERDAAKAGKKPVAMVRFQDGQQEPIRTLEYLKYYAASSFGQARVERELQSVGKLQGRSERPAICAPKGSDAAAIVRKMHDISLLPSDRLDFHGVRLMEPETFDYRDGYQPQAEKDRVPRDPSYGPEFSQRLRVMSNLGRCAADLNIEPDEEEREPFGIRERYGPEEEPELEF